MAFVTSTTVTHPDGTSITVTTTPDEAAPLAAGPSLLAPLACRTGTAYRVRPRRRSAPWPRRYNGSRSQLACDDAGPALVTTADGALAMEMRVPSAGAELAEIFELERASCANHSPHHHSRAHEQVHTATKM